MNCYKFSYVVLKQKRRYIYYFITQAKDFTTAYINFRENIKDGEIILVKLYNGKNLKHCNKGE